MDKGINRYRNSMDTGIQRYSGICTTWIHGYRQGYMDKRIQGYRGTWIQGTGIHGYMNTVVQGYRDTWNQGTRETQIQ